MAMKVAKEKSKQWILQNYLNTIYFGDGAYGVQAAAETYFNKPVWASHRGAGRGDRRRHPAAEHLPAAAVPARSRGALAYRAQRHGATGHLTAQQAAAMKFPVIGDNVPRTVGKDVWDPYVLEHGLQRAGRRLPLQPVADLQRRLRHQDDHRRRQDEGAVRRRFSRTRCRWPQTAGRCSPTCTSARCWRTRPTARSRPCTRARVTPDRKLRRRDGGHAHDDRQEVQRSSTAKSTWPCQPGAGGVLVQAVHPGHGRGKKMNVQTSTLDGFDALCIPPDP